MLNIMATTIQGVALYGYSSHESDELSFKEGDRFQLVKSYDDGWWKVNINGQVGMVPSNYFQADDASHLHKSRSVRGSRGQLYQVEEVGDTSFSPQRQMNSIKSSKSLLRPQHESSMTEQSTPMRSDKSSRSVVGAAEEEDDDEASPQKVLISKKSRTSLVESTPPPPLKSRDPSFSLMKLVNSNSTKSLPQSVGDKGDSKTPPLSPQRGSSINLHAAAYEGQTPELQRLKDLREQASAQIDALRTTVSQYEISQSKPEKLTKQLSGHVDPSGESTDTYTQPIEPSAPLVVKKNKSEEALRSRASGQKKSMQQVTLDPSSVEYISKIINDKIQKEFANRDKKLLDQVKVLVQESLVQLESRRPMLQSKSSDPHYPSAGGLGDYIVDDQSTHSNASHKHSADGARKLMDPHHGSFDKEHPSKIPRIKLPKMNQPQEHNSARSDHSRQPLSIQSNLSAGGLPPLAHHRQKGVEGEGRGHGQGSKFKEDVVSDEGVQYPHCRSVVYPSNDDLELVRQRNRQGGSTAPKLELTYMLGYAGNPARHGNTLSGKNILFISDTHIVYPAAAVVVFLDLTTNKQSFFMGHTDDVSCLTRHPTLPLIASSQIGPDSSKVFIWEYSDLVNISITTNLISRASYELQIPSNIRGVTSVSFSGDGKYLIASGIEDSKSGYIFDWRKEILLVQAKTGQVDVSKFMFNPFSYIPFQDESRSNEMKYASGIKPKDAPLTLPGCYTLVSYGGKQVKFWTFRQELQYAQENDSANGARDYRGRKYRENHIKYVLEGNVASTGKKSTTAPEYTSCCFVRAASRREQSFVYMGTMAGSIYIWQHVEDNDSWASRGKLLLVVSEAHEHPIVEMDVCQRQNKSLLLSSDNKGVINLWTVLGDKEHASKVPLEHNCGVQLEESYARSLCFPKRGDTAIVGTSANSLCLLNIADNSQMEVTKLTSYHYGKVKRLAIHPFVSNIFASISTDRSIRIWDGDSCCLLSVILVDFVPTAVSFSADGLVISVGTDAGALVILGSSKWEEVIQAVYCTGNKVDGLVDEFLSIPWEIVENKLVVISSG
ncbi:hypothetical protein EON65_11625 [archaeon]|nr:MAG: hypothetical protein EON65_11625 [archaeon]